MCEYYSRMIYSSMERLYIVLVLSTISLASIGIVFFSKWNAMHTAFVKFDRIYALYQDSGFVSIDPEFIPYIEQLPKQIQPYFLQLYAQWLVDSKDYTGALSLIRDNDMISYSNRASIKALWSYQLALSGGTTWLQQAVGIIDNAQRDIEKASVLSSRKLLAYVSSQKNTIDTLHILISVKSCFIQLGSVVSNLININSLLSKLQERILQQKEFIISKKDVLTPILWQQCYDHLLDGLSSSYNSMKGLQSVIWLYNQSFAQEYGKKANDIYSCIDQSYDDTLSYIAWVHSVIDEVVMAIDLNAMVLQSGDKDALQELCNAALNDSQNSEKMQNAFDQMRKNMDEKIDDKKQSSPSEEKSDKKTDSSKKKSPTKDQNQSSSQPQHTPIMNQQEQQLIKDTTKNSQDWINQMQQIKGQGNYSPERNIQELFKDFYGNPQDFKDLTNSGEQSSDNWLQRW